MPRPCKGPWRRLAQQDRPQAQQQTQNDPVPTCDRALLKVKSGGANTRPTSNRLRALNSMCPALPRFIDQKDEDGTVTRGFFNKHPPSFGQVPSTTTVRVSSGSTSLVATIIGKDLAREDKSKRPLTSGCASALLCHLVLALWEKTFDGLIGHVGEGIKKAQKEVMDERQGSVKGVFTSAFAPWPATTTAEYLARR